MERPTLAVQFLPSSVSNIAILNLGRGYSGMSGLIATYKSELRHYGFRPLKHPVILIVDNDDGGKKVIKAGEKLAGTKFDLTRRPVFFRHREPLHYPDPTRFLWRAIGNRRLFSSKRVGSRNRRKKI